MTRVLGQILLLAGKDLRIEARSRQTLGLVITLGVLIVTVLGLGLGEESRGLQAPAILWVAYLFGGVLVFEKTMAKERSDGAMAGLLMAPVDRGVIFLAKLLGNLVLMAALVAVITPAAIVLFGFDLSSAPGGFAVVMGLSLLGFAAVGTLFSALTSSTKLAGGLLAMLVFPVTLPLVIASTNMLLKMYGQGVGPGGTGLAVLAAFDLVFLVASWILFELVLEP